jgi:hypothetical protein
MVFVKTVLMNVILALMDLAALVAIMDGFYKMEFVYKIAMMDIMQIVTEYVSLVKSKIAQIASQMEYA